MLRTNSKQARQNIRNYIESKVIEECEINDELTPFSFGEIAEIIIGDFERVAKGWHITNKQQAFYDYASGIPNYIFNFFAPSSNTPYASDILAECLEQTEEQASKYDERESEKLLVNLIYDELTKACKG